MQVVPVEEQPAPVSGVVVGVVTEQPGASEGLEGRGSVEFLGRWNEKEDDRAMPIKHEAERNRETMVRVAFGRLVDELVRTNASSGILAISYFSYIRGDDRNRRRVTVWGFSWSASPDDVSYQRHGFVGMQSDQRQNIRFADFEGVIDDIVQDKAWDQIAVYRVTLPSGGLDPWKWAGRPPPPAPEELYTGPRSDGLLSTDEISGDYFAPCVAPFCFCNSMTVVPLGADTIETWRTGCVFFPPFIGPMATGGVRTRNPGTNAFLNPQNPDPNSNLMTFSADGTAKSGCCCGYKKRRTSQKRAFHKVETRDLAGKWRGCGCSLFVQFWPFSFISCTRKTALDEDRYEVSEISCCLCLPCSDSGTRTRVYVNGHPTNGFAEDDGSGVHWHRDPGCAGSYKDLCTFIAKKVG